MIQNIANGSMPFILGRLKTLVFGGPYRAYAYTLTSEEKARTVGVCMAAELAHLKHGISVPTQDFSIPDMGDFRRGIMAALAQVALGKTLYVGCMGGIGRTGLFLAGLAKVMGEQWPVQYVRETYIPSAVETAEQQEFIRDFDADSIRKWAKII